MWERYQSYNYYNADFYKSMNILPQAADVFVTPNPNSQLRNYSEFEDQVSLKEEPYMTLVVNAPCSYLWCWLGTLLPIFDNNQVWSLSRF